MTKKKKKNYKGMPPDLKMMLLLGGMVRQAREKSQRRLYYMSLDDRIGGHIHIITDPGRKVWRGTITPEGTPNYLLCETDGQVDEF